jgi:hypothetical protein
VKYYELQQNYLQELKCCCEACVNVLNPTTSVK